ncbi:DUF4249 family protein [Flavobacteriaceae bacterium TP-CH-4]|uniref:DUF4249 family protein n=1 Tax=Pelagihabitans pacificus TaxID=2696054 RepID=A0A967AUM5_9FLAO|nr:DUF4249 family protein [Pelagihabitans pacificus]NHF59338.1 DUF4249 family protein [Pelagihabitans pacificus]
MKLFSVLLGLLLVITSCEDVIEVDTPSEPPRLAIDGLIRISDTTATAQTVRIKAELTSSFFGEVSPANLESISITNLDYVPSGPLDSNVRQLTEVVPGVYESNINTRFLVEGELNLSITHEGQRYLAITEFAPSSPIDEVSQGDGTLFGGEETEVIISFTDDAERNDYYLFDFDFDEYLVTEDEFYNGQTFEFSYFYDDDVIPGMEVEISILGIDESFYNYMNQLIVQADSGSQGPFQTPSATVRGNIINVTNIDNIDTFDNVEDSNNFALGYFAVSQTFSQSLTIE